MRYLDQVYINQYVGVSDPTAGAKIPNNII